MEDPRQLGEYPFDTFNIATCNWLLTRRALSFLKNDGSYGYTPKNQVLTKAYPRKQS